MPSDLKWYDSNVKKVIRKEAQVGITRTAMLVRRQARRNLTASGKRDTGFLWNSIYAATPTEVTDIPPDGDYRDRNGKLVHRQSGPIVQPADGAHVGAAAEYAISVELGESFLYRAIEQVAGPQAEAAMAGLGTGLFDEGE
jgi:hypothetical protein